MPPAARALLDLWGDRARRRRLDEGLTTGAITIGDRKPDDVIGTLRGGSGGCCCWACACGFADVDDNGADPTVARCP